MVYNPSAARFRADVAQLARASACHAEGRGFESLHPLHVLRIRRMPQRDCRGGASGAVEATWPSGLGTGLQNPLHRFDSGRRLLVEVLQNPGFPARIRASETGVALFLASIWRPLSHPAFLAAFVMAACRAAPILAAASLSIPSTACV